MTRASSLALLALALIVPIEAIAQSAGDLILPGISISLENAPRFNAENPDDDRVYYQSWAGVSSVYGWKNWKDRDACDDVILGDYQKADKMHATLVPMAALAAHGWNLYPNDGMARVENAKHGNFRGCIPADHLDQVGYKADGPNSGTRFSHLRFYRNIAFELAELGF